MRNHVETPPPAIPYSCFSRQHCAAMSEADNVQEPVADRALDTTGENSTAKDADAPLDLYRLNIACTSGARIDDSVKLKILLDKVENMDIWKEQEGQTEEKDIVFARIGSDRTAANLARAQVRCK